jgi:hypothetical protein
MSKHLSFRNFLKNEEESYFSAMADQLGINPEDYKKDAKVGSFYSFGSNVVNIGPYSILDFKKNDNGEITHALVKQINDPRIHNMKYKNDLRTKADSDETFLIPIDDLQKLMMQGQDQPQQAADAGMPDLGGGVV